MPAASSVSAASPEFSLPVYSDHPADLLGGANSVLLFLGHALGECRELDLGEKEINGLALILAGVQQTVDRALKSV